jgi:hypothetical protein
MVFFVSTVAERSIRFVTHKPGVVDIENVLDYSDPTGSHMGDTRQYNEK